VLRAGEKILERLGYRVTAVTSSAEALALFAQDPAGFDLVITDQVMPQMTGIELARKLFNIRTDIPVILCTGFSYLVDVPTAHAAGVNAFAMKPLTKGEIARTVRKVLDG
jgi:CheY-like chemotaxis protein